MVNDPIDLRAFGRLVREHYAAVSAVAFATTRDPVLAEDVVQETFVAAWDGREQLRDPQRVRPWLCGIARNQARKALRGRRRDVEETEVVDAAPSVVDAAVDREALHQLRDALEAIPPEHREPLLLFYWEEQSIAQVASALAISDQAAQKRISRARQYLKDELATRLEPIGRTRKAASAAMATAVVAVLTTRTGAAHASAGKKGLSMSKKVVVKGLVVAGLAGGAVTGLAIWRDQASSAAGKTPPAASTSAARPTGKAPMPHQQPALPPAPAPAPTPASASHMGWPVGRFPTAAAYELTALDSGTVAVNLRGGKSKLEASGPPPGPIVRRIRGRVVDEAGRPVAGAAVLVDGTFYSMEDSLLAEEGMMSGADGRFDLPVRDARKAYALALHPRGWSALIAIPAGRTDADLVITIPTPAALTLHVKQGKAPRQAELGITQPGLRIGLETDERGLAEIALLAPGDYKVSIAPAQTGGNNDTHRIEQPISLEAGPNDIDVDLPDGGLLVATAHSRTPLGSVEWFLDPGTLDHPTLDLLRQRHAMPGFESLGNGGYKLDGDDVGDPMQYHELAAGTYTVCLDATTAKQQHLPLACREVAVKGGQTVELQVDVGDR